MISNDIKLQLIQRMYKHCNFIVVFLSQGAAIKTFITTKKSHCLKPLKEMYFSMDLFVSAGPISNRRTKIYRTIVDLMSDREGNWRLLTYGSEEFC